MEQQTRRTAQRTEQEQEQIRSEVRRSRSGPHSLTQTVRAVQGGISLGDLGHERLLELARLVGNSGMLALENMLTPPAQTHTPDLSSGESASPPFDVPEGLACPTVSPPSLAAGNWPAAAFECAGLS